MIVVWGVVLVVIALVAQHLHRSVLELALTIASVPYGSMLGIFLLGVLTKRANSRGALTGALVALAIMVFVVGLHIPRLDMVCRPRNRGDFRRGMGGERNRKAGSRCQVAGAREGVTSEDARQGSGGRS